MKTLIKKLRRGFTIVELVIVIAVIAILAAVLIPTLANVINSAEESADMQTVVHLNTILSSYDTVGDGAKTISEAIEQADENGYNVSKLTPTSEGNILWDQESNRFLLVDSNGEILYKDSATSSSVTSTKYQLWYIAQSDTDVSSEYSNYYAYTVTGTITSNTGVDVGNNQGVNVTITSSTANKNGVSLKMKKAGALNAYAESTAPSIRVVTNGGSLTINNADAVIDHYGSASDVTITNASSYTTTATVTSAITVNVSITITVSSNASVGSVVAGSGLSVNLVVSSSAVVYNSFGATITSGTVETNHENTDYSDYYVSANGKLYTTLVEAVDAAESGSTIYLLQDFTVDKHVLSSSLTTRTLSKDLTVDLNGYLWTITGVYDTEVINGATLTIKNGQIDYDTGKPNYAFLTASSQSNIIVENLEVTGVGVMLYPKGSACNVEVKDVNFEGTSLVQTNASSVDHYYVNIDISNTTVNATHTGVLINVPGLLNISESTIISNCQSVVVRGGTAIIDNCKIYNNLLSSSWNASSEWNYFMDDYSSSSKWGSGTSVPVAAITIGNDVDYTNAYQYAASCTVTNTEIHTTVGFMAVYIEGNSTESYGATLNYSGCTFYYHDQDSDITTGGTAFSSSTPQEYSSSMSVSSYAVIYSSDSASYITINGVGYKAAE